MSVRIPSSGITLDSLLGSSLAFVISQVKYLRSAYRSGANFTSGRLPLIFFDNIDALDERNGGFGNPVDVVNTRLSLAVKCIKCLADIFCIDDVTYLQSGTEYGERQFEDASDRKVCDPS